MRCVGLALALFFTLALRAQDVDPFHVEDVRMQEAVREAKGAKPILVFFEPEQCSGRKTPCEELARAVEHPANQRRLAELVFFTERVSGAPGAFAVYDPSGAQAKRWIGILSPTDFSRILTLIDRAAPYLADRAHSHDARATALAAFALGDREQGLNALDTLRASNDIEDQELGSIWQMRITAEKEPDTRIEKLAALGRSGSSSSVKFEALMAAGDLSVALGKSKDAATFYQRAADVARPRDRKIALLALQRNLAGQSPLLGAGDPRELVFGKSTLQPRTVPPNAASVEFRLDGKLVATARKPPFTTSVNFGRIPKRQVLQVTALDKARRKLQEDTLVVNDRTDAFSIHIDEPAGGALSGTVDVVASARVPQGAAIDHVAIEWNGTPVAHFTAPPYRTRITVGEGETGILRAVIRLDDGAETEDVQMVNSTQMMMEADVNLVEIPAYFQAQKVNAADVIVRENRKRLPVDRIVPAGEAPLRLALVLDSSKSMENNILDLQEAALRFLDEYTTDGDETMVVQFGTGLTVLPPTTDRQRVARSILHIEPKGATSLNDAMILALMRLQVSGRRRAMIVFTDGMDTTSIFRTSDVAEVARRIGVPIYVLSFAAQALYTPRLGPQAVLTPSAADRVRRALQTIEKISKDSGGRLFHLDSLEELSKFWSSIGSDLARQSLVVYRTDPRRSSEWRSLEISVKGGKSVRAPAGVYIAGENGEENDR
jgi:VWFA-related protein